MPCPACKRADLSKIRPVSLPDGSRFVRCNNMEDGCDAGWVILGNGRLARSD